MEVTVLLEAEPLGIDLIEYVPLMKAASDSGVKILLIGGKDDRFSYMHAKYAVVDGSKTVITSENWTTDNMNGSFRECDYSEDTGNRGWGVIIDSREYAYFTEQVFLNDADGSFGDVRSFETVYPNAKTVSDLVYRPPEKRELASYAADAVPFFSPDGSIDAEYYYMESVSGRLYSQQQSIGSSYRDLSGKTPVTVMSEVSKRCPDVRLIIGDSSLKSFADTLCAGTGIKAVYMPSPYVHNKGVICDSVTLVSSVNWTENSFERNRECGVAILSEEVSGYFSGVFLRDHKRYYIYEGFEAAITEGRDVYSEGEEAVFSVSVSAAGDYSYSWDLGDGRIRNTTIPRISFYAVRGTHVLSVEISDAAGNSGSASKEYTVGGGFSLSFDPGDVFSGANKWLLPSVMLLASALIILLKRRMRRLLHDPHMPYHEIVEDCRPVRGAVRRDGRGAGAGFRCQGRP